MPLTTENCIDQMEDASIPPRPPTPQVLLHRIPDKPPDTARTSQEPSRYIILIMGSTAVAGKVQIARSVAEALTCPLYQGDSLHESSAKAATVGVSRAAGAVGVSGEAPAGTGANEARYRRMWLAKLTRTGLLFPEESRPAHEGSAGVENGKSQMASGRESDVNSVFTISESERMRRENPALMVLTHPELEPWHKGAIRKAVGEYGIGVVFVPLYREEEECEEMPVLQPLDPTRFAGFSDMAKSFSNIDGGGFLDVETRLDIGVDANVEARTAEIIEGVRDVIVSR